MITAFYKKSVYMLANHYGMSRLMCGQEALYMEQNLPLYKIFYEVAKTENISRTSKERYISQPAISKSISKLESNLKTTLFTRNSRGGSCSTVSKPA